MNYLFAAADGHHGPNGIHLPGDLNEVYIGTVAFLVVVGLLIKFAGPSMSAAFKGRTAGIEEEFAAAKAEREAAEATLRASTEDLPDVSVEEERILAEARETAERMKADLIAQAQRDAEEIRTRGNAEVEGQRRQAVADLSAEVARMTREATEAIVNETLNDSAQADLIDGYINQLEQPA